MKGGASRLRRRSWIQARCRGRRCYWSGAATTPPPASPPTPLVRRLRLLRPAVPSIAHALCKNRMPSLKHASHDGGIGLVQWRIACRVYNARPWLYESHRPSLLAGKEVGTGRVNSSRDVRANVGQGCVFTRRARMCVRLECIEQWAGGAQGTRWRRTTCCAPSAGS